MNMVVAEIRLFNWKHSWVLLAFLGAIAIHVKESLYRLSTFDSFFSLEALAIVMPLLVIDGYALFWAFRRGWKGEAPSFLSIWAVFIFFIVASRIIITTAYLDEPMNVQVIGGLVLLMYGLHLTMQNESSFWKVVVGTALLGGGWLAINTQGVISFSESFGFGWWMLYIFIAAFTVAVMENIARRASFKRYFELRTLVVIIPMQIIINTGTFYGYRYAVPTFMFAWAVYTVYDVVLRIINNRVLGEPFKFIHMLGMMLVVSGTFLTYFGGDC